MITFLSRGLGALALACALSGCAVVAVADTAASIAVGTVGLAADATIGAVRIGGKVVGKTADVLLGDGED